MSLLKFSSALLALLLSTSAWALTVVPDCSDWYMHRADDGSGLEFRCYGGGDKDPWLTMGGCLSPTATRNKTTGTVTVVCGAGKCAGRKLRITKWITT